MWRLSLYRMNSSSLFACVWVSVFVSPSPPGSAALCRCVAGCTAPPAAGGSPPSSRHPPAPHRSTTPAAGRSPSCTGWRETRASRGHPAYSVSSAKREHKGMLNLMFRVLSCAFYNSVKNTDLNVGPFIVLWIDALKAACLDEPFTHPRIFHFFHRALI